MVGVVGSNPIVPTKQFKRSPRAAFCVFTAVLIFMIAFFSSESDLCEVGKTFCRCRAGEPQNKSLLLAHPTHVTFCRGHH